MSSQSKVLILGKLPPPCIGPAIATQNLLSSRLRDLYKLSHLDTNVHESLGTLGEWQLGKVWKNVKIYFRFVRIICKVKPDLVLIPMSQTTLGFIKDSVYILLSRLFSRKTLLQLRGSNFKKWLTGASRLTRNYVRIVLRTTQGVIVLGNSLRYLFEEYYAQHRIFVVPNGADYHVPSGHTAQNGHTATLLYLSNLLPSKGIEDVIQSAQLLKKKYDSDFA